MDTIRFTQAERDWLIGQFSHMTINPLAPTAHADVAMIQTLASKIEQLTAIPVPKVISEIDNEVDSAEKSIDIM